MNSTEYLRSFADGLRNGGSKAVAEVIYNLIDKIEEEHSEMSDFCKRLEEAAKKREDVTLFDVDYVALPVDEDGVAIRPGDIIDGYVNTFEVSRLVFTGLLWLDYRDGYRSVTPRLKPGA